MRPLLEGDATGHPRTELTEVSVRGFRNLGVVDLEVPRDGFVLVGDNGHGKSNFLEAVRYLTILRSARSARDRDVTQHGEDGFFLAVSANADSPRRVTAGFERAGQRKRVTVDGVVVRRLSDALGVVAASLLSPADVLLVSGGPGERRRYMDVLLSLIDPHYLAALQRYRTTLAHRNAALREVLKSGRDSGQIAVWEAPLAASGVILWQKRALWCAGAGPEFTRLCDAIGEPGHCALELGTHGGGANSSAEELLDSFATHRTSDARRGNTSVGPHRDDLRITLDRRELRLYGSGGQQRTAALALGLLECAAVREHQGRAPVLLLDDPFAELDSRRSERIRHLLEHGAAAQVILAVPREDDVPAEFGRLERFRIRAGRIERWG